MMEFLSKDVAQRMYASANYEYPVNPKVAPDPEVASWGTFRTDSLALQVIADLTPRAARMFNEAGLD